jgi:hypothetical protein
MPRDTKEGMKHGWFSRWVAAGVLALVGCGSDAVTLDAALPDAVTLDAALPDAALPDAALPDAALPDAVTLDAALPDAALPDAVTLDAALPDAVLPDAAVPDVPVAEAAAPDSAMDSAGGQAMPAQGGWSQVRCPDPVPEPRAGPALSYDTDRQVLVLFGGVDHFKGVTFGDTWEYGKSCWHKRTPASSPPPRADFSMAYDPRRHRTVLFGGGVGDYQRPDTWEYDGTTWTQVMPPVAPAARQGHRMAFHAGLGKVFLHGGFMGRGPTTVWKGDTWLYDGTTWMEVLGPSPGPRAQFGMAYDAARERVVVFGGVSGYGTSTGDLWAFASAGWTRLSLTTPPGARSSDLAYDSRRNRIVLFGGWPQVHAGDNLGTLPLNDTWELDDTTFVQVTTPPQPVGRHAHVAAFHEGRDRTVMFGGVSANRGTPDFTVPLPMLDETWEYGVSRGEEPGMNPAP